MAREIPADKLILGRRYRVQSRYRSENDYYGSTFIGTFTQPEYLDFENILTHDIIGVNVNTTTFQDSSNNMISQDKLIPGKEYNIVRNYNQYGNDASFTGRLLEPHIHYFENVVDDSESEIGKALRMYGNRRLPDQLVPAVISDSQFFETGISLGYNQAYRGLANTIPENVVGKIKALLEGTNATKGIQRFPKRNSKGGKRLTRRNTGKRLASRKNNKKRK
jgi:hypothetical protein